MAGEGNSLNFLNGFIIVTQITHIPTTCFCVNVA